jgi:hypothetical protein
MAPDFEYFLHVPHSIRFAHTVLGVFVFCLPVGLVVLWLFHHLLKDPLLTLAPYGFQHCIAIRKVAFRWGPPSRFARILASLLVGTLSHLFWDGFTHSAGWAAHRIPLLKATLFSISGRPIPLCNVLQHVSTLVGLAILAVAGIRWYRPAALGCGVERISKQTRMPAIVPVLALVPAVIAPLYAYLRYTSEHAFSYRMFAARSVIAYMSGLMAELLIFSVAFHYRVCARKR